MAAPRSKKYIEAPLNSPSIEAAIDRGIFIIITGISVLLVANLERRAKRIHLLELPF